MFLLGVWAAFAAALEQQRDQILAKSTALASDGSKAILDATTRNSVDNIIYNGVYANTGIGVGLRDPYTGRFVLGADGKALSFSIDKIMEMGKARGPETFASRTVRAADPIPTSGFDQSMNPEAGPVIHLLPDFRQ